MPVYIFSLFQEKLIFAAEYMVYIVELTATFILLMAIEICASLIIEFFIVWLNVVKTFYP